jgi:soluble lytic murein transglycosylase
MVGHFKGNAVLASTDYDEISGLRLTYDKDAGFTSLKGLAALERPDGKPLADEYGQKLQDVVSRVAGGLGNDAQRAAFMRHAGGMVASMRGSALQHEAQEFKGYSLSVSEGVQATALRDIGLNYKNPDAVDGAVERIRAETYRQAQLLGKSAEWQEAAARKMTSNAHKVALLAALESNEPAFADEYLRKRGGQMDADDILAVRGQITQSVDAMAGAAAAGDVMARAQPRIQVSEGERAFNIAVGTESGGRQFAADGTPLTSPKGAIGIAQVMPGTGPEAAKLAGLPWDENRYRNDPAYNKAIGMAYFQRQLQDNGGNLAMAYAAYNAGPGALKKAIKDAGQGGDWLALLPAETRNYVTKNLREFESGRGQPARPSLQELDDQLRADPRLANNPARLKFARAEVERRYKLQTDAIKERDEEAVATAMRGVIENGGSYAALSSGVRAAVPPEKVSAVMTLAEKIAKGDDRTDLATWLEFNNLPTSALAAMTPQSLLATYGLFFSTADMRKASDMIGAAKGLRGGAGNSDGLQLMTTNDLLTRTARELQIIPKTGQKASPAQDAAYLAFTDRMQVKINQWEATNGKKASAEVLRGLLDEEKLDVVRVSEWGRDPTRPFVALTGDQQQAAYVTVDGSDVRIASIPPSRRAQIVQALQASGQSVTEANIARLWVKAGRPPAAGNTSTQIPR